jgi:ABC-type uncharacterized transport system, permease component
MTTVKIRKYGIIMKTSLQSNMAYASNFLFNIIFYAFIIFIFMRLWRTIYGSGNTISGYTLNQMIWYCIITEMVVLSGGSVFSELNTDIKGGNIAYLLNKPYHYIMYQLSNSMGMTAVVLLINAIAGAIMGIIYVGPLNNFSVYQIPFIVLSIVLAVLLNFFIAASLGLTAFWLEENTAANWIYQKILLVLGVFLPVDFLPVWLQKITLLLPFSYVTYGPAKLVVDFDYIWAVRIIAFQSVYLVLFIILTFLIYGRGVKKLNVNGG